MKTQRLTTAQALVTYLTQQYVKLDDGSELPLFAGVWSIFGHGNVAGLGEALYSVQEQLPTYRGHNEQSMAHAAIAFTKARQRQQVMVATSSIGPGATNMVTAAALAHVNRLPVLLLPGDVFASQLPDPVLQQVEDFQDGTVSANDCFRPVSRYYDRISRPEQLLQALPRAMQVLIDPAQCGPVTLSICQDVQSQAFDYPVSLFERRVWIQRRQAPDTREIEQAVASLKASQRPLLVAGGGVRYSQAEQTLRQFAEQHAIPVVETQAGKSSLPADHALNGGAIGVTGVTSANSLARETDLVLAVGTRLQDFITGSNSLFKSPVIQLNVQPFDAIKYRAQTCIGDARTSLQILSTQLGEYRSTKGWSQQLQTLKAKWTLEQQSLLDADLATVNPSDAQVVAVVNQHVSTNAVVIGAAGSLPAELHKHWQAATVGGYHMEYGYSCMGYEIAAGVGVKLAEPDRQVVVMVGDGSYLMMNSDIATAVSLGLQLTIVVLDNRGFSCINRLQMATGGANFNNLLRDTRHQQLANIDFAGHARALGAHAEHVANIGDLGTAVASARQRQNVSVVVIDTDPMPSSPGSCWWEVEVPEVSSRKQVQQQREFYLAQRLAERGY
jgi:3D-(3,5/4)-trihydroxycyclohexane-1,2-dione acylhydrolase (decyclizing)